MATEAKRGIIRIASNYSRLGAEAILGFALVPLLLRTAGDDGWALIALLGSSIGLAALIQEVVNASLVRELGAAYHSQNSDTFRSTYNSTLVISTILSLAAILTFGVIWLIIPVFEIPVHLTSAARLLVVAKGLESAAAILTAAPFNMYRVTERMVAHNSWLTATKSSHVCSAVVVLLLQINDPAQAIVVYGFISLGMKVTLFVIPVTFIVLSDSRMVPAPSTITRDAVWSIIHIGGWNTVSTLAAKMHRQAAPIIMNLAFGLPGNLVLGLAIQLIVIVRRLSAGMTYGLDAVSTRLSTLKGHGAIRRLLFHSTRLHGSAAFPLSFGVILLAEPAIRIWVGGQLDHPESQIPMAVVLTQVMTVGMAARSISDGWIRITYGAGHVTSYAPLVLVGGLLHPFLAVFLIWTLPAGVEYTAVAWTFTSLLVLFHGILMPLFCAKAITARFQDFYLPLVRPFLISLACVPILPFYDWVIEQWTLVYLCIAVATYSGLYFILFVLVVMDASERSRFSRAALKRLPLISSIFR